MDGLEGLVCCEDSPADLFPQVVETCLVYALCPSMAAVAIPGSSLAVTTNQKLTPVHRASSSCCSLLTWHCTPRRLQGIIIPQAKAATASSPMAGGQRPPVEGGAKNAEASGQRRRRPVSALYAELAALLPGVPSRASKEEVVAAAAAQVKVLEDMAVVLESYRAVQQQEGGSGGAAAVEVTSREAVCFAARLPPAAARWGALRRVLEPFHRRGVEILAATITRRGEAAEVTVTAAATSPEVSESIKADIAGIE